MISAMTLTGCGQRNVGVETSVAMGTYISEEIDFPRASENYLGKEHLVQGENGELYCYAVEDGCKIYTLSENDKWKLQKEIKIPDDIRKIYKIFIKASKVYIAYGDQQGNMCIGVQQDENNFRIVKLNKDKEPVREKAYRRYVVDVDSNGDFYISQIMGHGQVEKYSGETGEWLKEYDGEVQDFSVIGDNIYTVQLKDKTIKVCDSKNGEVIKSINYSGNGETKLIKGIQEGELYLCNSEGIFRLAKEGVLWEQIITADQLIKIDSKITNYGVYLKDDSFIICYCRTEGDMLVHYYYNKDIVSNPDKKMEICMMYDDEALREAGKQYQEAHKDILIQSQSVKRGDRFSFCEFAQGRLNDKGMDLVEIEGAAQGIQEGELEDITDVVEELISNGTIDEKLVKNFKVDGKYYMIPTRYTVSTIWGNKEILNQVNTLDDLVAYKKAHPQQILFGRTRLELAYELRGSWLPYCFDQTGKFDEQKYRACMENLIALEEREYKPVNTKAYWYDIQIDKKKELLDLAEGKTQLVVLEPQSLKEVAEAAEVLKGRNDIMMKNLMSVKSFYSARGIVGINATSGNKEAAKEIIKIALSEELQRIDNEKGMPINKKVQVESTDLSAYPSINNEFKACLEQVTACANNISNSTLYYVTTETDKYLAGQQTIEETIKVIKEALKDSQEVDYYNYKSTTLN